jgi:hypothetical protein
MPVHYNGKNISLSFFLSSEKIHSLFYFAVSMINYSYFLWASIYYVLFINPLSTRGLITKTKFQYKNAQLVKNSLLWNKANSAPILSCAKSRKISILTQSFIESICIYPMQSFRVYRYFVDQLNTIGARRQQAIQGYHSFKSHALHDKISYRKNRWYKHPPIAGLISSHTNASHGVMGVEHTREKLVRAISPTVPFTTSATISLVDTPPQWRQRWHSTRLLPVNSKTCCHKVQICAQHTLSFNDIVEKWSYMA